MMDSNNMWQIAQQTGSIVETNDGQHTGGLLNIGRWRWTSDPPWYPSNDYYWQPYYVWPVEPRDCSGDVHVFPCPHCDKCKCGKAKKVT